MEEHDHEEWKGWLPSARESCQQMAGKIEALMKRQQEFQRSMQVLRMEQESFLRDMRTFADGQRAVNSHAGVGGDVSSFADGSRMLNSHASHVHFLEGDAEFQAPQITPDHVNDLVKQARAESRKEKPDLPSGTSTRSFADMDVEEYQSERITMSTAHLMSQLSGLFNKQDTHNRFSGLGAITFFDRMRAHCQRVLRSQMFEPFMGVVILINAANIGWTIEWELRNQDTQIQTLIEIAILGVFWAELFAVFFVSGYKALVLKWTIFDFLLNLVTTVALIFASIEKMNSFAEAMKQMLILRMMRLLRLFRAVRLIQMSRSLWKLVEGMRHCMGTMVAALILICISLYVFGCFGAELITKAYVGDDKVGTLIDTNFSSLPRIMLTLFQFIAMDSTAAIYVQLVHRSPILFVYFIMLVVLITIMLMNLITAVVVEDAITTATMDHEMKRHFLREKLRKLRPAFQELFNTLDVSNDGTVVIQEIVSAIQDGINIPVAIQDLVTPSRMLDLFDLLDQDNSGELSESEFVDGLSCLALSEVPLETMQIMHLLRSVQREVYRLQKVRNGVVVSTTSSQPTSALRYDVGSSHGGLNGNGHSTNKVTWGALEGNGVESSDFDRNEAYFDDNGKDQASYKKNHANFFGADGGFHTGDDGFGDGSVTCDGTNPGSPGSDRVRALI